MPHFLLQLIGPTPVKIINKACNKLYDHVEQFISSSAMSKVVADNKSPGKSVNRLSYGLFFSSHIEDIYNLPILTTPFSTLRM